MTPAAVETLGMRLRALRKQCGWSQAEVASTIGMKQQGYRLYESDAVPVPIAKFAQLCLLFSVPADELLALLLVRATRALNGHAAEGRATLGTPVPPRAHPRAGHAIPHVCHAIGCHVPVQPRLLMDAHHWRMVPPPLRAAVLTAYRPGQEEDKQPSQAYLQAASRAIIAVAEQERQPIAPVWYALAAEEEGASDAE